MPDSFAICRAQGSALPWWSVLLGCSGWHTLLCFQRIPAGESLTLCFVTVCAVCGTVRTRGCATLGRGDGSHFCLHCEYWFYLRLVLLSAGSATALGAFQCPACRNCAGIQSSRLNAWSRPLVQAEWTALPERAATAYPLLGFSDGRDVPQTWWEAQ